MILLTRYSPVILKTICLSIILFYQHKCLAQTFPLSDPKNSGNWVLNTNVSDEFDSNTLDEDKWQIQGKNGVYKSNFIGRQPSQFSPNNAIVENNKLKIQSKWEPDFDFNTTCKTEGGVNRCFENITTAAVISKKQFHYGYMEIKSKAAKAEVTSSFWTTGNQSELDMFEMFGDPKESGVNKNWSKRLKFNMISWDPNNPYYLPDGNGPAHTRNIQANSNTADDFHVYGFDWTPEYIKVYIDGVLKSEILKSEITNNGNDNNRWVTDVPYWIWFDSETFWWLGLPEEADFDIPVEYEIEYIRVWEHKNLLNTDFFGFENAINIENIEKNWFIPAASSSYFDINDEKAYRWNNSLKFEHNEVITNNAVAFAPFGSVNLNSGIHELSLKVWLASGSVLSNFQIILENPYQALNFDVTGVANNQWVTLNQTFTRNTASETNDRLRVRVMPTDVSAGSSTMYIDDIFINQNSTLSVASINKENIPNQIFPNPLDSSIENHIKVIAPLANKISIYNVAGIKLLDIDKNTDKIAIDASQFNPGIYFIKIHSNTTSETKKIIIK